MSFLVVQRHIPRNRPCVRLGHDSTPGYSSQTFVNLLASHALTSTSDVVLHLYHLVFGQAGDGSVFSLFTTQVESARLPAPAHFLSFSFFFFHCFFLFLFLCLLLFAFLSFILSFLFFLSFSLPFPFTFPFLVFSFCPFPLPFLSLSLPCPSLV